MRTETSRARCAGLVFVFLWFFIGIAHFVFTQAEVRPAHIYMLQEPGFFPPVPYWALVLRLPLQVALLALIAWIASRPADSSSPTAPSSRA